MKICSLIFSCIVIVAAAGYGQSKYSIELIGGKTLDIDGLFGASSDGVSGGAGAIMVVGAEVEIVANAVFSRFPHGSVRTWIDAFRSPTIVNPSEGEDSYSCAISVGPRIHAHPLKFLSPYILMQGGLYLIKFGTPSSDWGSLPAPMVVGQFLTAHGSKGIQPRLFGSVGLGVQVSPTDAFNIDLEAKIQVLSGQRSRAGALVPLLASVELPL